MLRGEFGVVWSASHLFGGSLCLNGPPLFRINAHINTLSLNQSAEIVKAVEIRANDA
jgi:hypothetical protein